MLDDITHLEIEYYNGYLLDGTYNFDLSEKEKVLLDNAIMLIDNNWSLRCLSRNVGKSKSQLHRDFQLSLKKVSFELYHYVNRVLQNNYIRYFK